MDGWVVDGQVLSVAAPSVGYLLLIIESVCSVLLFLSV